jgi:small redox-active disulfide protein 2
MNKEIKIQVLGSGCPTCKKLYKLTKEAVAEMNLGTEVEYIADIQKIIEMGVMSSPVLAINGKPVMAGFIPAKEKVKEIIKKNIAA